MLKYVAFWWKTNEREIELHSRRGGFCISMCQMPLYHNGSFYAIKKKVALVLIKVFFQDVLFSVLQRGKKIRFSISRGSGFSLVIDWHPFPKQFMFCVRVHFLVTWINAWICSSQCISWGGKTTIGNANYFPCDRTSKPVCRVHRYVDWEE